MEFLADVGNPNPGAEQGAGNRRKNKKGSGCLGCLGCFGVTVIFLLAAILGFWFYISEQLVSSYPLIAEKEGVSDELKGVLKEKLQNAKKSFDGKLPVDVTLEFTDKELNYLMNNNLPNTVSKIDFNKSNLDFKLSQKLGEEKYINLNISGDIKINNFEMLGEIKKFAVGKINVIETYQKIFLQLLVEAGENNFRYKDRKIKIRYLKIEDSLVKLKIEVSRK